MIYDKEIHELLEDVLSGTPLSSLVSIEEYIEYAEKHSLISRYFPILNCAFIVVDDQTIFLTAEKGGTTLSIKPMWT